MSTARLVANSDLARRYPDLRVVFVAEGGTVSEAEDADRFLLVIDERALGEALGDSIESFARTEMPSAPTVLEFATADDRRSYESRRGWIAPIADEGRGIGPAEPPVDRSAAEGG